MKISYGRSFANINVVFILTKKEEKHLDKLVSRVCDLREISYNKYQEREAVSPNCSRKQYNRLSSAHENAKKQTNNALIKVQNYISKTLGIKSDDAIWDRMCDGKGIAPLGDVLDATTGVGYWDSAAQLLLESFDSDGF